MRADQSTGDSFENLLVLADKVRK